MESGNPPAAVCLLVFLCGALISLSYGCGHSKLPGKSSKEYTEFVSTFYTGLAALQVGDDVRAESKLGDATKIAPGEPAAWADWGILALRQRNFDVAAQRLGTARELAPARRSHLLPAGTTGEQSREVGGGDCGLAQSGGAESAEFARDVSTGGRDRAAGR